MRRIRHLRFALLFVVACGRAPEADPRIVSDFTHILYGAVRAERLSPAVASRLFAYAEVGLYAGLAATDTTLPRIEGRLNELPTLPAAGAGVRYEPTWVAVVAERVILDSLMRDALPTVEVSLHHFADSVLATRVASRFFRSDTAASRELGTRIANVIVQWAHGDGFDSTRGRKYVTPTGAGLWVNDDPATVYQTQSLSGISQSIDPANPTAAARPGTLDDRSLILGRTKRSTNKTLPAANMAGVTEPYWGDNRPFALAKWDECPAPPPPAFSPDSGTPFFEEAREVYNVSKQLTSAQRQTALYWADNGGESGTPAGHWLSIAGQMVGQRKLTASQAAWLSAVSSVALADAFIAAWGYKFRLNLIRPRTFIRASIDSTWEPAIPTPPFPEYLSGHSTVSAAVAGTLTGMLGAAPFDDSTSVSLGHGVRRYASFNDAAAEAGLSRIYGGIHFPSGNMEGRKLGACIASVVLKRMNAGMLRAER